MDLDIRTGWAKHAGTGQEYVVRLPLPRPEPLVELITFRPLPRVQRLNTLDRTVDAAIFCLNRARIRELMRAHVRANERAWDLFRQADALVKLSRKLGDR